MPNQYTRDHLTPLQAAHEIGKILDRVQHGEARTLSLVCVARSVSLAVVMDVINEPAAKVQRRQ